MTSAEFAALALSFPGTEENPHFDRRAFKVTGKRIFATLHEESKTANLKFSPADQNTFCSFDKKKIYPIANKWGLQGWTTFDIRKIPSELMLEALNTAYQDVMRSTPKKKK
jgi:predicted DNA-binding protein (MmcQ/YjbR family)